MTLPVALYVVILFSQFPANIILVLTSFIQMAMSLHGLLFLFITFGGLALVLYSSIYLFYHRKEGLVTTGPYRFIRHPQYTGFIFFTLGLTIWSHQILVSTFGIGWLTPEATILLWFVQFATYMLLAKIEDLHLAKNFGNEYHFYKQRTGYLFPLGKIGKLDIPLSVVLISLLLFGLLFTMSSPLFA